MAAKLASALLGLPAQTLPHEPGAQLTYVRTERFELSGGDGAGAGRNIAYSCEHRVVMNPAALTSPARPAIGPRLAMAIAGAAVLAGGVIGYGRYQPPPRRPHAVTILLDRASATTPTRIAAAAPRLPSRRAAALTLPIAAPVSSATLQIEPPASAREPATLDVGKAIDAALAAAFATNEMQNWEAGDRSGVVVVGPAALVSGSVCRDVAVLTRSEGAKDSTVNSRRCQARDGLMLSEPTLPAPLPGAP